MQNYQEKKGGGARVELFQYLQRYTVHIGVTCAWITDLELWCLLKLEVLSF